MVVALELVVVARARVEVGVAVVPVVGLVAALLPSVVAVGVAAVVGVSRCQGGLSHRVLGGPDLLTVCSPVHHTHTQRHALLQSFYTLVHTAFTLITLPGQLPCSAGLVTPQCVVLYCVALHFTVGYYHGMRATQQDAASTPQQHSTNGMVSRDIGNLGELSWESVSAGGAGPSWKMEVRTLLLVV
jgi:hypothetical protein